jgi:3-hydroxy-9,10-secoandrosta-1,3,5(10)-triene-9,17-dione monooxygenase reductase component
MNQDTIDPRQLRQALGNFATGVTIVTTKNKDDQYVGVTANSFSSVSMDPPLVLWSLDKGARSLTDYQDSGFFTINVLAADQMALSNKFARAGEDKFSGVAFNEGKGGTPVLEGTIANFQCKTVHQYEGGDHIIFVGEVLSFDKSDGNGLLFHKGSYCVANIHPDLEEAKETA